MIRKIRYAKNQSRVKRKEKQFREKVIIIKYKVIKVNKELKWI